jgi:Domain of unknown function (DUF4159)
VRSTVVIAIAVLIAGTGASAARFAAQTIPPPFQGGGRGPERRPSLGIEAEGNTPYDGRFVFVRLRYSTRWDGFRHLGNGGIPWSHDYPDGEMHFMKIMQDITLLKPRTNGSNILDVDDPELFNYPVAYMAEPGFWNLTDRQAESFRAYLQKGGFVIFDDFRGYDWDNLQDQMRRVLPNWHWVQLDGTHPIFHAFFEINDPLAFPPPYGGLPPSYWGIFENNDPKKRLVAIANVNNDISEYWEWSGTGYAPVDLDNEAYKFGVNYVIYGMTH